MKKYDEGTNEYPLVIMGKEDEDDWIIQLIIFLEHSNGDRDRDPRS